jgi:hypothetical protein
MAFERSDAVIEHGSSKPSRWLGDRRTKIALWIAVLEGIVVALEEDVSRWTVVALAAIAVAIYVTVGRRLKPGILRNILWVFGFSQLLAVIATILSWILSWLAILLAVLFAIAALLFLLIDRR